MLLHFSPPLFAYWHDDVSVNLGLDVSLAERTVGRHEVNRLLSRPPECVHARVHYVQMRRRQDEIGGARGDDGEHKWTCKYN